MDRGRCLGSWPQECSWQTSPWDCFVRRPSFFPPFGSEPKGFPKGLRSTGKHRLGCGCGASWIGVSSPSLADQSFLLEEYRVFPIISHCPVCNASRKHSVVALVVSCFPGSSWHLVWQHFLLIFPWLCSMPITLPQPSPPAPTPSPQRLRWYSIPSARGLPEDMARAEYTGGP